MIKVQLHSTIYFLGITLKKLHIRVQKQAMIAIVILIPIVICLVVASSVYSKQQKAGKNPWAWTIASFLITLIVLLGVVYAMLVYAFSFER